ncbi:nucleotidyltransferase family protein [Roseiflexus sp.]|uniref:nucleotidyltransferase family protein n=1 Tax=Roseiflexus sp. TaxID=2562120 RepID=UPI00398B00A5
MAELVNEKRADILALAAKHGARNVRMFGSVARGDVNEQSDIDFLAGFDLGVDLNEIWNAVENDIPELGQAVKRLVRRLESADASERRDV